MTLSYFLAIFIGISLGLIGGGGSILTVPVLVYIVDIKPTEAMRYSLFVVGITAWLGTLQKGWIGQVNARVALLFFFPSMVTVYATRTYLLPLLPEVWLHTPYFILRNDKGLMLFFAALMLASARSMINSPTHDKPIVARLDVGKVALRGVLVGILTGLVGAGGGFLIVPSFVLLVGLEMKMAIGTSLLVIATNSTIGFVSDFQKAQTINWSFLLLFSGLALFGVVVGNNLAQYLSNAKLKTVFGWFVLAMGVFIVIKEVLF